MTHLLTAYWPYLAFFIILFVSAMCFFIRSAQPKSFDQMTESQEQDETEYTDHIKIISASKEPKINSTIPL